MSDYIDREKLLRGLNYVMLKHSLPLEAVTEIIHVVCFAPAVDVASAKCGRWVKVNTHNWKRDKYGEIDMTASGNNYEAEAYKGLYNGPLCVSCGLHVSTGFSPNWQEQDCIIGHYECTICGGASETGYEKYCPHCGAKMLETEGENK